MAIQSMTVPKDMENKTSREIRIGLKKVTKVSSQTTSIPSSYLRGGDTGVNAGTSGTGSGGGTGQSSSASGDGASKEEEKGSILYNLINN